MERPRLIVEENHYEKLDSRENDKPKRAAPSAVRSTLLDVQRMALRVWA